MKLPLFSSAVLFIAIIANTAMAADPHQATFTLEKSKVIFQNLKDRLEFDVFKVPGLLTVKFEPKTLIKDGKEIDVSKLILENQSDGSKLILVQSKPIEVIWNAKSLSWKPIITK